jgi:hypothetical protein
MPSWIVMERGDFRSCDFQGWKSAPLLRRSDRLQFTVASFSPVQPHAHIIAHTNPRIPTDIQNAAFSIISLIVRVEIPSSRSLSASLLRKISLILPQLLKSLTHALSHFPEGGGRG